MSIQKLSGGRYRARVKDRGVEIASKVFDRHADARRWEAEQLAMVASGTMIGREARRLRLAEFFPRFVEARIHTAQRTRDTDMGNWRRYIEPEFGSTRLADITEIHIRRWVGRLLNGTYKPGVGADGRPLTAAPKSEGTVKRALGSLSAILQLAVEEHVLNVNPVHAVKIQQGANSAPRSTALNQEELATVYATSLELELIAYPDRELPQSEIIPVLGYTGLRWSELAALRSSDFHLTHVALLSVTRALVRANGGGAASYKALKGYRRREVPVPPTILPIVERWADASDGDEPLFPGPKGGILSSSNWRRDVQWEQVLRAASQPGLRPHDLRHTCATMYLREGVNPKVVQQILGHSDVQTTLRIYSHILPADIFAAANVFSDPLLEAHPDEGDGPRTPGPRR